MKYSDFFNGFSSEETIETVLTLPDLSPSMSATDFYPTRLDGAIKANNELIDTKLKYHPNDKVGIIGFGEYAKILHPPVCLKTGSQSLKKALEITKQLSGTNFTAALNLAERCFLRKPKQPENSLFSRILAGLFVETDYENSHDNDLKRIIMLTDGHHNCGSSPLPVAARLKNAGVVIDCIGIGGSPEDVDEDLLKKIASKNPDGSIRYCFIGDKDQLIRKYKSLANHIQVF